MVAAKTAADNGAKVVIVEKCEEGKAVCPLWVGGFAACTTFTPEMNCMKNQKASFY